MKKIVNSLAIQKTILVCFIVLFTLPAFAQYGYYHSHSSAYPPRNGGVQFLSSYYTYRYSYYEHNDCRRFLDAYSNYAYLDSNEGKDVKFKTATLYYYFYNDSLLTNKKLGFKSVYNFNKSGQITYILHYDTVGKLNDSATVEYDIRGNRTRISDYDRSMSPDKLQMRNDELFTWDSKNRMIHDSDFEKKNEVTRYDTSQYNISRITYKYDDSDNVVYQFTLNNSDTVIEYNEYDKKNRLLINRSYQYKHWTYRSNGYDANGNEIKNISIFNNLDTNSIFSVYDAANRRTNWQKFHGNKLTELETCKFNPDSSYTMTEETLGDNTGPSCPEDNKTISLYNIHHDCYSKITTQESNGKLLTTTTLDKLLYNKMGKLLRDSEMVTGKSQWHWDKTLTIHTYKYDTKGNRTESDIIGGENQNSNTRKTETFNDKNNILEEDEYGACMDKPFKSTITKYYPDGKTVKELQVTEGTNTTISKFGKDSRFLEKTASDAITKEQWVWEYTEW